MCNLVSTLNPQWLWKFREAVCGSACLMKWEKSSDLLAWASLGNHTQTQSSDLLIWASVGNVYVLSPFSFPARVCILHLLLFSSSTTQPNSFHFTFFSSFHFCIYSNVLLRSLWTCKDSSAFLDSRNFPKQWLKHIFPFWKIEWKASFNICPQSGGKVAATVYLQNSLQPNVSQSHICLILGLGWSG